MRVDAKAEGETVVIGGWKPVRDSQGQLLKHSSVWFSVVLTKESAPWAFQGGKPYTKVAALELLATTVSLVIFRSTLITDEYEEGAVEVTGHTDSAVSAHVVARGITTAFPLCIVAMELSAQ